MDPFNSRFILKEKRWLWIDYDKGISIILVGYGHALTSLDGHVADLSAYPFFTYIGTFLYGFRMPLFFIVSGLLVARSLNKKGLNAYIGDRTNNILYPLAIWGFIEITFQVLSAKYFTHNNDVSPINYLNLIIDPRQTGHFWYLNALFCIGVIYAFLRSRAKLTAVMQVILGFILFSISAYIHIHDLNFGFVTDVFEYYIFFAIGDLVSKLLLDENNIKRLSTYKVFLPLLVFFVIIQYFFTEINLRPNVDGINYVDHKMPFFFLLEALVGCSLSLSFSFLLQKYKLFTFLRIVGYHSLFVYCMQIIVMSIARIFLQNFLHITYTPALIILIWLSGILLPIFFYNLTLRLNIWWLYTFRKPEKQVDYLRKTNIFSLKRHQEVPEG